MSTNRALMRLRLAHRWGFRDSVLEVEGLTDANARTIARFRTEGTPVRLIGSRSFSAVIPAMLAAAIQGHWDDVRAQLAAGTDPETRDNFGNTVLHYAALTDDVGLARTLVDHGVPIGFRNSGERTAEELARERGHLAMASWLVCREVATPPDERRLGRFSRIVHLMLPLWAMFTVGVVALVLSLVYRGTVAWVSLGIFSVLVASLIALQRSAPSPAWTPIALGPEGITVRRWRQRLVLPLSEVTVLAVNGRRLRTFAPPTVAIVGWASGGLALDALDDDRLCAVDQLAVTTHATGFERIRVDPTSFDVLVRLVRPLLERGVPVSPSVHRVVEHHGWSRLWWAAAPLRRQKTWRLATEPSGRADPPPSPPGAVAVSHTGHIDVVSPRFDGSYVTTRVTVTALVTAGSDLARRDEPLIVDADVTFSWVAGVIEQIRATGVEVQPGLAGVVAPPDGTNALIDHIATGRTDLALDLIRSGWDLRAADPWHRGPMAYAVATHSAELVDALLLAGADPLAADDGGRTPRSLAEATWGTDDPVAVACRTAAQSRYGRFAG